MVGFIKWAGIVVTTSALIAGCASKPKPNPNPFIDHWKTESEQRQGYSPSVEDLSPEPRVLMYQQEKVTQDQQRPLPSIPVTLKLQDVGVNVVLRSMASAAGVSLMLSPAISGTVSLNVKKARWDDVFMSIIRGNALDYSWQGSILQVVTAAEKQKEVGMISLNNQLVEQYSVASHTGPLSVSVVNIRYSDAQALKASLMKFVSRNKDAVIEIDEHNNALILQGTESEQKRLLALVEHLDRPRSQVQLRAYIVETTKEKARELGMQWGGAMRSGLLGGSNSDRVFVGSGGSAAEFGKDPVLNGFGTSAGLAGLPMGLDYSSLVNSSGTGNLALAVGSIGGNILETQLNMMEREGVLNILSSPSITTLDNKMAYTENGEKVPYVSKDKDGDNDVKFEDAVLRLEMTPNVIDKANMKLKVLIKKDEVDTSRNVDGNPYIIKKQTETTVMVRSGETIVISGLTKEKGNNNEAGVPGLKNLPGGKYVFGSTNRVSSMEEVLIFITPIILPTRLQNDREIEPLKPSPSVTSGWEKQPRQKEPRLTNEVPR